MNLNEPETTVPKYQPGVIGETPLLKPGQAFEYMSCTQVSTKEGTMQGSFLMSSSDGSFFEAIVAPFKLLPLQQF